MKMTAWFPGDINPVFSGVYNRIVRVGGKYQMSFSYFHQRRKKWFRMAGNPDDALVQVTVCNLPTSQWRGVVAESHDQPAPLHSPTEEVRA